MFISHNSYKSRPTNNNKIRNYERSWKLHSNEFGNWSLNIFFFILYSRQQQFRDCVTIGDMIFYFPVSGEDIDVNSEEDLINLGIQEDDVLYLKMRKVGRKKNVKKKEKNLAVTCLVPEPYPFLGGNFSSTQQVKLKRVFPWRFYCISFSQTQTFIYCKV